MKLGEKKVSSGRCEGERRELLIGDKVKRRGKLVLVAPCSLILSFKV